MRSFLLSLLLLLGLTLHAQLQECGAVAPAGYAQQLQQRLANLPAQVFERSGLIMVPVHVHLFRQSDGTSNLTLQDVQNELDSVNDFYANAGLRFYECQPAEMIDDDSLYDFESSTEQAIVFANHYTMDVINLYFANSVSLSNSAVCGYAYFPGGADAAFIAAACATNGSTTAHELGHYFGLYHTHGGSPDELVDGSNCSWEGDYICDTPADPGLSGLVDSNCVYTGTYIDLNSMFYTPDVHNIMSYSRKVCRNVFSPTQYNVIYNTWLIDRQYLNCVITAAPSVPSNKMFSLFPNPSPGMLTLQAEFAAEILAQAELRIASPEGKIVKTLARGTLENGAAIFVDDLAPGIYFYSLLSGEEVLTTGKVALVR